MIALPSVFTSELSLSFSGQKPLEVKFSPFDMSENAGVLLLRQVEEVLQICQGLANCLIDSREPGKIKHPLVELIRQRVYQIAAGYEDVNDSNRLRNDPIFKIVCERIPRPGEELLASQPTLSRLENRITKKEINSIRSFFIEQFLGTYEKPPEELVLDIDGWDAETHGEQQLSLFHGYYSQYMYFPVLINEAQSGYQDGLTITSGKFSSWQRGNRSAQMVILAFEKSLAWSQNYITGRCGFLLT